MKGITVNVLKHQGDSFDCKGNFSSHLDWATLVSFDGKPVAPVFEPTGLAPAVAVVTRMLFGKPYLTAYPCKPDSTEPDRNCSFGGCFLHSSDSRFSELSQYPIPLHDRKE